jgi:hypothetical protein
MSALTFLDITPKFSTFTMFVMFTDELFLAFETTPSTYTGLWYGQAKLGYPALLILLESCAINIFAAKMSWEVISLQLKGKT